MATLSQSVVEWIGYLVLFLCIPLAIHGNIKLFKQKNEMFVQKRSVLMLFGLNITFICGMILFTCLQFSLLHLSPWYLLFFGINIFLFWYSALYFLLVKQWIIFFKYHWTRSTMQRQWQCIINSTAVSHDEHTWFIENNQTFGNIVYIRKLCALYILIGLFLCIIATLAMYFSDFHGTVLWISISVVFIVLTTPIIIYVVIACKTPSFDDTFYIHWEGKAIARLMALLFLTFMGSNVFVTATDDLNDIVFGTPLCILILCAMNHVSTNMIYDKNMRCKICKKDNKICTGHIKDCIADITLEPVLSDKNTLHMFMIHLSKEFSLECVLSFIEISQFQTYCIQLMEDSDADKLSVKPMIFPKNVPMSHLIENKEVSVDEASESELDSISCAKIKAHNIYNKYIRDGSEFEVNISWIQRKEVVEMLDDLECLMQANITFSDLVLVFEETKKEMMALATFSLSRFRKQEEFDVVAGQLNRSMTAMSSNLLGR